MSTGIEWTDETWNPVTGCTKVSEGCAHCYIERTPPFRMAHHRFEGPGGPEAPGATTGVKLHPERLDIPLHWRKPRRIFVCSLADLFHEDVPDSFIAGVFGVMARCPEHTFQVLTKRPGRMSSWVRKRVGFYLWMEKPLPNVWLGTSVESQKWADVRIPKLLETPAAVRFLSCEPLLGPIDLRGGLGFEYNDQATGERIPVPSVDWVIVGGESGPAARPMRPDWARSLRDQCVAASVPYFFKQWGEWVPSEPGADLWNLATGERILDVPMRRVGKKAAGRELDGRTWDEYPETR